MKTVDQQLEELGAETPLQMVMRMFGCTAAEAREILMEAEEHNNAGD